MKDILLLIPIVARVVAVILFLCPKSATAQMNWNEVKADGELAQKALELSRQNGPLEAAELINQRIKSAGFTVARQNLLCTFYSSAGEMGALAKCVAALRGALVDGRVPPRDSDPNLASIWQSETDTVYFNSLMYYQTLGDFKSMVALGEAGLAQTKLTVWALIVQLLGDAYLKLGDRESAKKLLHRLEQWQPGSEIERANYRATRHSALTGQALKQAEDTHVRVSTGARLAALSLMSAHLGNYEAALAYFDQRMAHSKTYPDVWMQKNLADLIHASDAIRRAMLLVELGRFGEAREEQAKAEKLDPGVMTENNWQFQFCFGRIAEAEGKVAIALDAYRKAVNIIESRRMTLPGEEARIGFATDKQEVYTRLVSLLIKAGSAASAFEYAERGKSRALVDLLASRSTFGIRGKQAQSEEQDPAMLLKTFRLADATAASRDNINAEQRAKTRNIALDSVNRLKRSAPELASLVTVSHTPAAELQAMLKPNEAIVEYFGHREMLFAFVVTRQSIRSVELDAATLPRVTVYRRSVQDPNSSDTRSLAMALHAALVEPLGLTAGQSLIIVPHGALHYLPFAALDDGKLTLLDRHSLRVLPSASIMPLLASRRLPENRNMLIFGNPDLGDAKYDLPGAQREAHEIAKLRPGSKVLVRKQATREAAHSIGGQYAYLHFASHGTFDARSPRSSGLLLANPQGSGIPTEGLLTVDELYNLHLNADLVTMSACETALVDVQSGDDVVGMVRGFFYAGANNVVASLWQVDDAATEQLMVQFYKNIVSHNKLEALRRAQLAIKAKHPHPFFWAAFQLSGIDPLTPGTSNHQRQTLEVK